MNFWDNQILKLRLFEDNRIIIENYHNLKDFQTTYIIVDNYYIEGSFLKINKMSEMAVEINGKIKEIKIIE